MVRNIIKPMPEELVEYIKSHYPDNDPTMKGFLKVRNNDIYELREHGYGLKDIGDLFGISYQRVQQMLAKVRREKREAHE